MLKRIVLIVLLSIALAACGSAATPAASDTAPATAAAVPATAAAAEPATSGMEKVTLGLGYIPTVQFAPFYVAQSKGYYAAEGLEVDFSYGGNVNDLLLQTAAGKLPFVVAAGDEVLLARTQQVPVQMVFLLYQKAPVAIFSKAEAGITEPQDLKGKTIGIPGRFGATYIGLRGVLYASGMQESDVNLSEIGFTQFEAVREDTVPVAVGYASNEPLRLEEEGVPVDVIKVADHIELVSNGIVVSEAYAAEHGETVRKFIRATSKGLGDTLANSEEAFEISLTFIPEMQAADQPFQRKVLDDTLDYWRGEGTEQHGLGWLNPPAWQATYAFLRDAGILKAETDPTKAYSEAFVE
jgi:NitT/TauT family transport system substrate-binding protein